MTDQKIFELMLKTPDIRAVQLSDWLDQDLKSVSEALRDLVDTGNIVKAHGTAPNGQPAMIYNFSDEFKGSREYCALVALAGHSLAPVVPLVVHVIEPKPAPAAPAPAETLVPVAPVRPVLPEAPLRAAAAGPSRAERAIAAILERGPLSDADLREVMGIREGEYPSSCLGAAVKAGKVYKGAAGWSAGAAPLEAAPCKPPRFNTPINPAKPAPAGFEQRAKGDQVENVLLVGNTILVSKDHHAIAPEVVAAVTAAELTGLPPAVIEQLSKPPQAIAAAAPEAAVFRCGLWSDGVIELQRNGAEVARLTRGEGEELAGFLGRMLQASAERLQFQGKA